MNLSLHLQPEFEKRLRELALQDGVHPEICALSLLEDQLSVKPLAAMSESDLLLEISLGLSETVWRRYRELIDLREQREILDEREQLEFVELNELVETTHARRMSYVAELALRRGVELRALMDELGFPNHEGI